MLKLITSYTFSNVPYISYDVLDEYAEAVVRDAMSDKLLAPCPIDAAWFVEIYLGMEVVYKRLSYDRKILGMTAFDSGYVQVRDDITGESDALFVEAGTVILDPSLTTKRNTHLYARGKPLPDTLSGFFKRQSFWQHGKF